MNREFRLQNLSLPNNARVLLPHGSGYPRAIVTALTHHYSGIEFLHNRIDAPLDYVSDSESGATHRALMAGHPTREGVNSGRFPFIPNSFGVSPRLFRSGAIGLDAVVVHLSPPDNDGWMSYGTCTSHLPAAVDEAPIVIGQINDQMPVTAGDRINIEQLDAYLMVSEPLIEEPAEHPPTDTVAAIANEVAKWVPDSSYVQVGIGVLGNSILRAIGATKTLALWTETFGDSAIDLLEAGAIKSIEKGVPAITSSFVTASKRTYAALEHTLDIEFRGVDSTNDPSLIRNLGRPFRAVNSAIEIDLTGQVNAESIGGTIYGGPGGQLDFAIGCALKADGKGIWALPAQTRTGISRIVPTITAGNAVTIPRTLTGVVVTEFGSVDLEGRSLDERAKALISIAHPDHRERLLQSLTHPQGQEVKS